MTIPSDWPIARLETVLTDMQPGFAQAPDAEQIGIPQLRTNNISDSGALDLTDVKYVHVGDADLEKYVVRRGDVIFNNTNSLELVGRTAYFDRDDVWVLSNHMTRLRVDERLVVPQFLAKYLHYLWQRGMTQRRSKQWVNQAAIDQAMLAKFDVPLPPLPEQRRIVEILRKAEGVRELTRRASQTAESLLSALFGHHFGHPVRNERAWKTQQLRDVGEITTGNTPPRDEPQNYGDYIEWVKSDDLDASFDLISPSSEKLSLEGATRGRSVPPGSTLITCIAGSPESIGKAALADRRVAFNQQINAVTPFEGIDPYYLYTLIKLSKPAIQALSSGGMKGIVTKGNLERLSVIVPPKPLRDRFGNQARAIFEHNALLIARRELPDTLVNTLLGRAFMGELTAEWRTRHSAELEFASAERDQLLEERGARLRVELAVPVEPPTALPFDERRQTVESFSDEQRQLLALINEAPRYWTAETLQQEAGVGLAAARRALALFAATGLIMQGEVWVSESRDTGYYLPAYWPLRPEHEVRMADLGRLSRTG